MQFPKTLILLTLLTPALAAQSGPESTDPLPDRSAQDGAEAKSISDQAITDAIQREITYDRAIPSHMIAVSTKKGVVTLSGRTSNLLTKERAIQVAETVRGVRSIIAQIEVVPPEARSDALIESDIEDALFEDAATDSYEVDVKVADNVATLSGAVDSWAERELSERVAKGVRGVVDVQNELKVRFDDVRPDSEIEAEIQESLRWNTLVDHGLVRVSVENGDVTLNGSVGSLAEKRQVYYEAWTHGVRTVENELTIDETADKGDLRAAKYVDVTDDDIVAAVEAALLQDPRVFSFNVRASADQGIVTLRGEVDNLKAKRAAQHDAQNTVGVLSVRNLIQVRPNEPLPDEEIATHIRDSFRRDPYVERFETAVSFQDGTAYLYGTVDNWFEKLRAEDLASRANGVRNVENNLEVRSLTPYAQDPYLTDWDIYSRPWYVYAPVQTFKSDEQIAEDIEDELWWSPFVSEDQVQVSVENGVATLEGQVDSWSEWRSARENAYEGGAVLVRNQLDVATDQEANEQ